MTAAKEPVLGPLTDDEAEKLLTEWRGWDAPQKPQLTGAQCERLLEYVRRLRVTPEDMRRWKRSSITLDVIGCRLALALDHEAEWPISLDQVVYDVDRLIDVYFKSTSIAAGVKVAVGAHRLQHAKPTMHSAVEVAGHAGVVVGVDGDQVCVRFDSLGERSWFNVEDVLRPAPETRTECEVEG